MDFFAIKSYTNDELKDILNNQEGLDFIVSSMPKMKLLQQKKDDLINQNKQKAKSNLELEKQYNVCVEVMKQAKDECQALQAEIEKKNSKLREISRQHSSDTILALMQAAMAEAEESSDEVANKFLNKETSIDDFLKEFSEKRKLFHSRRIKVEKMPEEIRKINNSSSINQPVRPAPPPPYPIL